MKHKPTTVRDASGTPIGRLGDAVGTDYVEIERDGPSWMVPIHLLGPEVDHEVTLAIEATQREQIEIFPSR